MSIPLEISSSPSNLCNPYDSSSFPNHHTDLIPPSECESQLSSPKSSNISVVPILNVAPSPLNKSSYPCKICATDFPTGPSLNSHIVDTHMSLEEYQNLNEIECPHCFMRVTFHNDGLLNHRSVCIIKECPKTSIYCSQNCFFQEYLCPLYGAFSNE